MKVGYSRYFNFVIFVGFVTFVIVDYMERCGPGLSTGSYNSMNPWDLFLSLLNG